MSQERDLLKSLLLKEELEVLNRLKEKVLSQEQFTEEVAKVLAKALKRAEKNDANLQKALYPPIKKGVLRAFSESKQSIIDSLLPIMGTLIRKTVSNSIKKIVADINRVLEQRLSLKHLKWRWQAYKAGISYAEIVFQKTIRYQVQELFLINRNNGLLIEHAGDDDLLKDNNAISAMLTVIQDFIRDSLQSPNADLLSTEIGDKVILISTGPQAFLASIIKGSPTERLKEKSQKLIENVHAQFSFELAQEDSYRNLPRLNEYLKKHLVLKNITESNKKINWVPWVLIPLIFISGLSYLAYKRLQQFNAIVDKASHVDGFYLQSVKRQNKGFVISGLLDPLADVSHLKTENIRLETRPFVSLDDSILEKRVQIVLKDYVGVIAKLENNKIELSGKVQEQDKKSLILRLNNIIGIEEVIDYLSLDMSHKLDAFFRGTNLNYKIANNIVSAQGEMKYQELTDLRQRFKALFKNLSLNTQAINVPDSTENILEKIKTTQLNIPLLQENDTLQKDKFEILIKNLQLLQQRTSKISIEVIGMSDCHGNKSDGYSMQRAKFIASKLHDAGINPNSIKTRIRACASIDADVAKNKLNAIINVKALKE